MRRARLLISAAALASVLTACTQLVRYTDQIVDERTGRSLFVTVPATAGGFCGFLVGLPADILALPVTLPVYYVQRDRDMNKSDPLSTLLFPSFALWRAGTMIAVPMDVAEYLVVRVWRDPETLTEEERKSIEEKFDRSTLSDYPVKAVYPVTGSAGAGE